MTHKEFNKFLESIQARIINVLASKSADYSANDDKLYNFYLAGRIDDITAIEALRGMHLKHHASIAQGLDEIKDDYPPTKTRDMDWWYEKCTDDINYTILLLALIKETYYPNSPVDNLEEY